MAEESSVSTGSELRPELVRGMRHELLTSINQIIGYCELLLEEAPEAGHAGYADDLRRIHLAAAQLLALVQDLLDPSRPSLASMDPELVSYELRTPLDAVIGYCDLLIEEAEEVGAASFVADLRKIREAGSYLTGVISAVLALTTFTPQPSAPGQAEGAPAAPPAGEPEVAELGVAVGGATLLVVDDSEASRDILARRLERLGYTVRRTADGPHALELLADGAIDLVLLDVVMPGLDGYAVCRQIRANPATSMLPVVMITAGGEQEKTKALEAGADDFLPKPFNPSELLARIRSLLRIKHYHDTIEEWNRTLEQRVREQVAELERLGRLRRFLAPQVAELVLAAGNETLLESHRREITAVYCGLRGFTALAETGAPEEVMQVLREYHEAMGELIFRFEGTLEHFVGEAMVVLFNDPLPCPDPAARAVRMALAMRERFGELAGRWWKRGYELEFAVGIATGYATLGRIGFQGRFDYAAIGAVTSLAARLCGEAGPGQILVARRVLAEIEELAEAEPVGELALKGLLRPVAAFNVVRLKEPAPAAAASEPSGDRHALFVLLIADVRDYTRFTHEHGDEAAARLAGRFAVLARQAAEAHEGRVVELRGDEAMAVFPSARQALRAAVALQARCQAEATAGLPLRVGIGLEVGEPVPLEGGYRGEALNVAARLSKLAGPGEVLACDTVVRLARRVEGLAFVPREPAELKGLPQPVDVWLVRPAQEPPAAAHPPVAAVRVATSEAPEPSSRRNGQHSPPRP